MDKNNKPSRYGRLHETEATIRSIDSAYATGNGKVDNPKQPHEGKIKAYVDFTEFNKNYAEYLKKKGVNKLIDRSPSDQGKDGHKKNLERQNSSSSNQSEESWEVLS